MIGEIGAKELGAIAYKTGKPINANPFRDNTEEARQFDIGWNKTNKEISKEAVANYKYAKRTFRNEHNS